MRIISGKYGRRRFSVPGGIVARPTTDMARENLFNILRGITDIEGATTLDLCAGTGAITVEMLRHVSSTTLPDSSDVKTI